MKVISFNANGIRSAGKKGFFSWLANQNADIVCLQETKAHYAHLTDPLFFPEGYHVYYSDAEKKGYSGVAIYTRQKPDQIHRGLGWKEANDEGRYVQADFGNLTIASIYFPSGTSGDARQTIKYQFMEKYRHILEQQRNSGRDYIICGDWNIAHKTIDLKNWYANQKTTGFLPEERAWLDEIFENGVMIDGFRVINQEPHQYTWWSQRSITAWEKNVGWRIDYQVVSPSLKDKILTVEIYRGEKFSDHAPLIMEYDITV